MFNLLNSLLLFPQIIGKIIFKKQSESKPTLEVIDGGNEKKPSKSSKIDKLEDTKGTDNDIPTTFKQTEFASSYEARLNQTPSANHPSCVFESNFLFRNDFSRNSEANCRKRYVQVCH